MEHRTSTQMLSSAGQPPILTLEELDRILQQLQIRRIVDARPILWIAIEQPNGTECTCLEEQK